MNTQFFDSTTEPMVGEREAINAIARLRWLMGLRWLALLGVSLSASLAVIGLVPGINLVVMLLGVGIGIGSNLYIQWGLSHRDQVDIEGLHVGQALFDTLVLSLVLWSAGGADCPFTSFYVFPVLLSVLLSARRTFWPTAVASVVGLLWQELASLFSMIRIGEWNPIKPWDEVFNFIALILTIGMVAYFAARFTEAIREQVKAKRAADELLRLSFERLQAGVEVIEGGTTVWQNPFARKALGERRYQPWSCPGQGQGVGCDQRKCGMNEIEGGLRCRFSIGDEASIQGKQRLRGNHSLPPIYDVMLLSPPDMKQKVAIYIDQTSEVLYQRKLVNTERLASLGRTAQGVAHELNTPLATIQTLGRDVLDVLNVEWNEEAVEDVKESTQVILEEVQRCSRITHALLGRSEPNSRGQLTGQMNTLESALNRAIALVFPHETHRVHKVTKGCEQLQYPFDPLVQIFVNLIQNANDAISEKYEDQQLSELPKIKVLIRATATNISINIIDQGGGISVESSLLFEPFYTTKSIGQGTGLGLYTSYALAQELSGELSIGNNDHGGATATLTLPLPYPLR